MRSHVALLEEANRTVHEKNLIIRQLVKFIDEKDVIIAQSRAENEALKVDMEVRKPRKKKRVQTSPDSRFVDIEAIEKSRGIKIASPVESEDEEDQESEVSCIIVKW